MAQGYEYSRTDDYRTLSQRVQETKKLYSLGLLSLPEYYEQMNEYRREMGLSPWRITD